MNKENTIKFLKIRDVISPNRAHNHDAGIDFYVPKFTNTFIAALKLKNPEVFNTCKCKCDNAISCDIGSVTLSLKAQHTDYQSVSYNLNDANNTIIKFDDTTGLNYFLLYPHSSINIPSGIKSRMSNPERALIAFNKSGVATKHQITVGACVVDYEYEGEIHINLINTSTKLVRIYEDMKATQFIEIPIYESSVEVVEGDEAEKSFYDGFLSVRKEKGFGSSGS